MKAGSKRIAIVGAGWAGLAAAVAATQAGTTVTLFEMAPRLGGRARSLPGPAGSDRRLGFITSGPAFEHVREAFPNAPVLKLGFSCPLPFDKCRELAALVDQVVVVEEVEPLIETEVRAEGVSVHGKDILPRIGELSPNVLKPAIARLLGEPVPEEAVRAPLKVFPRPPTMCVACPHLGVYYTLSQLKNIIISGDIGCYTLGAGHPWNALDTCISMGASMGIALGLDKGRSEADKDKRVMPELGVKPLTLPCLMVTASWDAALPPAPCRGKTSARRMPCLIQCSA